MIGRSEFRIKCGMTVSQITRHRALTLGCFVTDFHLSDEEKERLVMMCVQNKKTFKPILLSSGMVLCLFLAGCRDESASHYYHRGVDHMIENEFDQAILCFDKAIKINPRYAMAYFERGTAYCSKGEYDLSISDYNKGIEIAPDHPLLHNNRSVAYYYKGEYDKAWEDVHKAQSLGLQVQPEFLKKLREASGREK